MNLIQNLSRGARLSICIGTLCYPTLSIQAMTFQPAERDTLNTIHVLFRWPQFPEAIAYHLQVTRDNSDQPDYSIQSQLVAEIVDSTLAVVINEGLEWDQTYQWRVNPVMSGTDSTVAGITHTFTISALPGVATEVVASVYNSQAIQPGLTIFADLYTNTSLAVTQEGVPVWYLPHKPWTDNLLRLTDLLPNGNVLTLDWKAQAGFGYEMTLDNQVVWASPTDFIFRVHHDLITMPEQHYLGLTMIEQVGYIPDGPWKGLFDGAGMDSVIWLGDRLVEWDKEGNEVWSWSVFDHFSQLDYDSATFTLAFHRGYHDWTHSNAIVYDSLEQAIYVSVRNLSRITKIAYPSGEIIWNLGRNMPSGETQIGNDIHFSYQHSVKLLPNHNIMLYDNGGLYTPLRSRAVEIALVPDDPIPSAEVAWEYVLPEHLFTPTRGDADRLPNGNTLITAAVPKDIGVAAQILEITQDSVPVWRLELGTVATGRRLLYRSHRIPGLYPQVFSVMVADLMKAGDVPTLHFSAGSAQILFSIHNEGWLDQSYDYSLTDTRTWFGGSGSEHIPSGGSHAFVVDGTVLTANATNQVQLVITPQQAPAQAETLNFIISSGPLFAEEANNSLPHSFALHAAYPNPFNPQTTLRFDLPEKSDVTLLVYDVLGREVATLVEGELAPGYHQYQWNGCNQSGHSLPSGIYFVRLLAPKYSKSIKLLLMK